MVLDHQFYFCFLCSLQHHHIVVFSERTKIYLDSVLLPLFSTVPFSFRGVAYKQRVCVLKLLECFLVPQREGKELRERFHFIFILLQIVQLCFVQCVICKLVTGMPVLDNLNAQRKILCTICFQVFHLPMSYFLEYPVSCLC